MGNYLIGALLLALFFVITVALGWLVLQPLGKIRGTRVTVPRFRLPDLFWLLILLQPSFALYGLLENSSVEFSWILVFGLVWFGTVAGWACMAGVLSKAGIERPLKRAAGILVILPMIGVVIPACVADSLAVSGVMLYGDDPFGGSRAVAAAHLVGAFVFAAAIFGCRQIARWIASGAASSDHSELPN